MSEKQWVRVNGFVQVNRDAFEEDPEAEVVHAIRQRGALCLVKDTLVLEDAPPVEFCISLAPQEIEEDLLHCLEDVNDLLKESHDTFIYPEGKGHPDNDCRFCNAIQEADDLIAKTKALLQTRIDAEYDFDDDYCSGPR